MLKIPTEAEAFAEFSRSLNEMRELEGLRKLDAREMRQSWAILEIFRKSLGLAPSSTSTPCEDAAPHGGVGSGDGSGV